MSLLTILKAENCLILKIMESKKTIKYSFQNFISSVTTIGANT